MWRQLSIPTVLAALLISASGCSVLYPEDPLIRLEQNMIDGENLGQMRTMSPQPAGDDQTSHFTPYRVHGGVGPSSSSFSD
jgi:hypothetical protein